MTRKELLNDLDEAARVIAEMARENHELKEEIAWLRVLTATAT